MRIRDGLAFDDRQHLLYTAVHEVGHAVAGAATLDFWMDECVLTLHPGAAGDAYTDVGWGAVRTQLAFLPAGELAQIRWLREKNLWTPMRGRSTRNAAMHDRAASAALGFSWRARHTATLEAESHPGRHWLAVLQLAHLLSTTGRIRGEMVCAVMNLHLRLRGDTTGTNEIMLLGPPTVPSRLANRKDLFSPLPTPPRLGSWSRSWRG